MKITKYNFTDYGRTTAILVNGYYIWIAFAQDGDGICKLLKQSIFNLDDNVYELDVEVDEIKKMTISSGYLYLAVDDDTYGGIKISITNPLSAWVYYSKSGITESMIDVIADTDYVYFLTAGEDSDSNSHVLKVTKATMVLNTDIDLNDGNTIVENAKSFTIDSDSNIWIVTNEIEAKLIKLFYTDEYKFRVIYSNE